jgi:hypothetical protein
VLIGLWLLGSSFVYGQVVADIPAASYGFLDLRDPRALADEAGQPLLTFAQFDANDTIVWTRGFADVDAWCRYAQSDPNLAGGKTEQPGWILCGGDEEVFWPLQALLYVCPFYRGVVSAVESRPLLYDVRAGQWGAPGIALTDGDNLCYQATAFISWNPTVTSVYDRSKRWHHFPPLVALAHELIHAQQRVLEDEYTYGSTLQIDAMKGENLARYAFYRKVPGNEDLPPRPGNQGYYLNARFNTYFDDMEWADWSPDFSPLLDIFEEQ